MPLSGQSSVASHADLFVGEWPRIYGITPADVEVYLGMVKDGVLRTARETLELFGTDLVPLLELSAPTNVSMQFAGTAHELTYGLMHFLIGDAAIDDDSQYVYPGAACAFGDVDLTLRGERVNCDGNMIAFQLHRARGSGAVEIGSAPNDAIGTPIEVNALNDSNGDFGGSSDDPLGWIWFSHEGTEGDQGSGDRSYILPNV